MGLIASSLLFIQCQQHGPSTQRKHLGFIADSALVVSARAEASQIGVSILRKGGNAFDAMIATEFALAVAYPFAGNLGGGGFMVYRTHEGLTGSLDYREKAPMTASKDMYLDKDGQIIPEKSTLGGLAVGVPGTVAGMIEVHKKFGSLPLSEILDPVIKLARKGVVVTKKQANRLASYRPSFRKVNPDTMLFLKNWKQHDTIKYPALATTLELILKEGRDGFYKGVIAQKLTAFIRKNGGIITEKDLENYQAIWRKPITFEYDNLKITSMAPPSSGGICLAQIMNSLEPFDLHKYGHNQTKTIQVITEASRRSYADRSFFLGDPDFVKIPMDTLISKTYAQRRMQSFSFERATPSQEVSHGNISLSESDETTHYSIVDSYGNAIAATTTLNGGYGSKLYAAELGFFLNNEMDDFSSKPGSPNMFGMIGAEANAIAPEKRMLSSMTPTIIEKDGRLWMSLGTPGGSTIITSVLQTILNVHEFGMGMQEAVSQPRFHHQWLPDTIRMEPQQFDLDTKQQLQNLGYQLDEENSPIIGKVEGILVMENGQFEGGADPRGDDTALGF